MPLMGGSRKKSRGNTAQADGTRLEGWDFIQEKVLSHDEDMISDYSDDIDTLLVFAGLFSAVLTAFLVVALLLLQPDQAQTTNQILSVIALRLPNGNSSDTQPFLNDTAAMLPTSTTFKAPKSSATINTLWFTSLVLSLAAALFGILAKQWCREYLRWHNVIEMARENLLSRQVRFEAWDKWKVGVLIAIIPAFLEIALILFLIGLPIFARTYSEDSLTAVVSAAVAFTLLGVVALTILPVFYRLCPFQTPTGWAFVRLARPLRWAFWQLLKHMSVLFNHSLHDQELWVVRHQAQAEDSRYKGWQTRLWVHSMAKLSSPDKQKNWRAYGLHLVQDAELCKAIPAASDIKQFEDIFSDFSEAAVNAVQTSTLLRALTWVRLGSSDETVRTAIQDAITTIHATIDSESNLRKASFLSAIHTICPIDVSLVQAMTRAYLYNEAERSLSVRPGSQPLFPLRRFLGPYVDTRCSGLEEQHLAVCEAWASTPISLELSHSIIRFDLLLLVDNWLERRSSWTTHRRVIAERIALLLCMLRMLPSDLTLEAARAAGPNLILPLVETLEEVYRKLAPHEAAYEDGLVSMCVEMCRLLGPVTFQFEHKLGEKYSIYVDRDCLYDFAQWSYLLDQECNLVTTWATLAADIYRNIDLYEDANGRHLFVTSVSRVFETMRLRTDYSVPSMKDGEAIAPVFELLTCMVDALRWSLAHSLQNCGAYILLPWVKAIVQCYQAANSARERLLNMDAAAWRPIGLETYRDPLAAIPLTGDKVLRPTFLNMLRLLKECIERNLIVRATVTTPDDDTTSSEAAESEPPTSAVVETPRSEFDRLLDILGHPELPALPEDLKIEVLSDQQTSPKLDTVDVHDFDLPGEFVTKWPSLPTQC